LAASRSRRTRKDKNGRLAALNKLKELKSTGQRIKYEVSEIENVYDEINEGDYSEKVQQRLEDDWIVDDGGGDYVEDGREMFDEDFDAPEKGKSASTSTRQSKSQNKKKIKVVKSSDIKNLLLSSGAKKKVEKNVDLSNDELLGDILQEINTQTNDPLSVPRAPVVLRKKKKLKSVNMTGQFLSALPVPTLPSSDTTHEDPTTPPAKRCRLDLDNQHDALNQSIKPNEDAINDIMADFEEELGPENVPAETKPTIAKKSSSKPSENFLNQLTSLGWETVKGSASEPPPVEINVDSSNLPNVTNTEGDKVFRFYWLDAHEDQYKQPGVVYLFGKVFVESAKGYVSCCVTVKNVERKIFVLPRSVVSVRNCNRATSEEVTPEAVYQEFDSDVATNYRIMKFKTKIVEKKYAFGEREIPHQSQYLQISYPADHSALPSDLSGDTFQCIFGTNQSPLEALLIDRKMKGPCWIDIQRPQLNKSSVSWCKVEVNVASMSDLSVAESLDPPPLTVLSLSIKTIPNLTTHQNEVVGIAGLVHTAFPIDKCAPKPAFQSSFCGLSKPSDCIFPYDFRDAIKRRGLNVDVVGTERSLLSWFLAKIFKIDPDIVIGHDVVNFDLDVMLHRITTCKVAHWSRIGRLRKLNIPKTMSGGKFSERAIASGRILCDVKISARELIRCRSYDLGTLTQQVLNKQRKDLPTEQIKNMFMTSDSLLWLVEHILLDASFILDCCCELNALPLALQITNIAGNVLSRTLMGGRSERNEFLLLHAFNERDFILPDKYKRKRTDNLLDPNRTRSKITGWYSIGRPRKKAAYEGGLVLDPKRGFYDKFILLLDFNSLYPSIIQEYNICFTTLDLNPEKEEEVESYIPDVPETGLEPGVLPTEIRKLVERRRKVKQLMKASGLSKEQYIQYDIRQKALKLTANSMYGCLGFTNSRFYAKPLAALVTRQGREILLHTKELVQKMGLDVIYGDTDSIMINTNSGDLENAFKLGNQVKAEVNKLYKLLEIDIDGVYKSLLLLKKKKYAALSVQKAPDGSYTTVKELKGLDIVRRDWCDLAKLAGNYAVEQILSDEPRENIVERIHQNLQEIGEKIRRNDFDLEKFEIRKELTKDPHLYPGKDNLPHVRVALRVNSTMSKRMKSGDIVSYIICQDGSSEAATHRAYTIDEVKSKDELSVDEEYYMAQQIHPVVTRLCDPIDGTDAAMIAQCLGLDPSGFKRSHNEEEDEEDRLMSVQATEEEKFSQCSKLIFVCPQTKKEIALDQGVFAETVPTPCGENDASKVVHFFTSLQNQLTKAIRGDIHRYYQGWLVCEDPACGHRTRTLPVLAERNGVLCSACFKAVLKPEVSYQSLYHQLCYYKLQFDVEYAMKKYKQTSSKYQTSIVAAVKVAEYRGHYKTLSDVVDFYLNQSGYNEVSLPRLF
uniref:DNA polymerase n=1 Tax=Ciona savignyi TaxID=51511 RepID=H2Y7K6_CIOSA